MENAWGGTMVPGEKAEGSGEFAGAEGASGADSADTNYMYASHGANSGGPAGEGY